LIEPQTSGGLLVSCAYDEAEKPLDAIISAGYPDARIIGRVSSGTPEVQMVGAQRPGAT